MSWNVTLVEQLRYYINDINSSNYSYTDAQLAKFIAIAGTQVFSSLGLSSTYTVDVSIPSINPDPESDKTISALLVLKAAVIITAGQVKYMSSTAGYKVVDDRSSIDGQAGLLAIRDLLKFYTDNYNKAEESYLLGEGNIGCAVLSPYTRGL